LVPAPKSHATILALDSRIEALSGVGPERAAQLGRLKIRTIGDLLLHKPRRYEDRRRFLAIKELKLREPATTRGRIVAQGLKTYRKGTRSVFEFVLDDGTARLHCRWWNQPFMEKYFALGDEVMVYGKPNCLKPRTMDHPETEVIETGDEVSIHLDRIAPIYPLTEGLPQRWLRSLVWRALAVCGGNIAEPWAGLLLRGLPSRAEAVRKLHFPDEMSDVEPSRQRLALEEFIELQLSIQRRRRHLEKNAHGLPCGGDNRLIKPFLQQLSFKLTDAQTRVLREVRADLRGAHPMRRLLQGDVGSGKTLVAACSALMTIEGGFKVALMAPTEILADQHFQNFTRWFGRLGIAVELRTGSRSLASNQSPIARGSAPVTHDPHLIIGTHALIEASVTFEKLGLVIIDEQHKFGVAQREQLVRKQRYPHLLVMTATPIPRTLGLTLYGDLDVSVIDELPAARGGIKTFVRGVEKLPMVWDFIRQKLAEGRQAYVVYPRVDEVGEPGNSVKAVTQEFERVQEEIAPFRAGLLHGRLRAQAKEQVMSAFRNHEVHALVATSVVEVGLDVPNATVMLVENAEQFGLAQLHQLRGRIGRGAHESYCVLVAALKSPEARQRLRVLEETSDGFRIAEADLKLRGPGELLGQQQSGLPPFRFGDLANDLPLIDRARALAAQWLDHEHRSAAH
jgi:ATP-dependent DNA helicase RecG